MPSVAIRRVRIVSARQKLFQRKEAEENRKEQRRNKRKKLEQQRTVQDARPSLDDNERHEQRDDRSDLLKLAMRWNCIDAAKELILKNSLENIMVSICHDQRTHTDHACAIFRTRSLPFSTPS